MKIKVIKKTAYRTRTPDGTLKTQFQSWLIQRDSWEDADESDLLSPVEKTRDVDDSNIERGGPDDVPKTEEEVAKEEGRTWYFGPKALHEYYNRDSTTMQHKKLEQIASATHPEMMTSFFGGNYGDLANDIGEVKNMELEQLRNEQAFMQRMEDANLKDHLRAVEKHPWTSKILEDLSTDEVHVLLHHRRIKYFVNKIDNKALLPRMKKKLKRKIEKLYKEAEEARNLAEAEEKKSRSKH